MFDENVGLERVRQRPFYIKEENERAHAGYEDNAQALAEHEESVAKRARMNENDGNATQQLTAVPAAHVQAAPVPAVLVEAQSKLTAPPRFHSKTSLLLKKTVFYR